MKKGCVLHSTYMWFDISFYSLYMWRSIRQVIHLDKTQVSAVDFGVGIGLHYSTKLSSGLETMKNLLGIYF